MVEMYRSLLRWMLNRDYTKPRAFLRNTLALGSFTAGFVLLFGGLAVSAGFGGNAAAVLMWPGFALAGIGLIGILFHTLETIFDGGWSSVRAGVWVAVVGGLLLAVISLGEKEIGIEVIQTMMSVPIILGVIGLLGVAHRRFTVMGIVDLVLLGFAALLIAGGIGYALVLFALPGFGVEVIASEDMESGSQAMAGMLQGGLLLGMLGVLGRLAVKNRGYLVLTDNRARLMNSSLGAMFAIIGMFAAAPTGVEFFPETDPSQIKVNVRAALGTNIEASNQLAIDARSRIEQLFVSEPKTEINTKNVLVNVGVGGDVLFGGGASGIENSSITLNVVDYADRAEKSSTTLARVREEIAGLPGADIEIEKDQQGPPTGSPVNIEISGDDFDTIVRIAGEVKGRLRQGAESGEIPGLVDIRDNLNTGRPELRVNINRERAVRFGLSTRQIASTIRTAINGTEASKFRDGEDDYDITVRLAETDRNSLESLRSLTIFYDGRQIPLVSVADFEIGSGLGSITRLDQKRVVTVRGENAPGFSGPEVLASAQTYLSEYRESLPHGYIMTYTGESEEQDESFSFLTQALIIGVMLIFVIMVGQFNKVSLPFIIMVAVGFSMVGVMLGLILTRTMFGLMTFIGIISLAGIVVNNNIVLVDYIMQLRDRGLSKKDAIVQGGATRLRPVLLTALTTVLGLIPLTFGINIDFVGLITSADPAFQFGSENTQFWGPMGTAIISGLVFATFLTLVIVPVMYSLFDSLATRFATLTGRGAPEEDMPVTDTRSVGTDGTTAAAPGNGQDGIGEEYSPAKNR